MLARGGRALRDIGTLVGVAVSRGFHEGASARQRIVAGPKHIGKESGAFSRLEQAGPIPDVAATAAAGRSGPNPKMEPSFAEGAFFRFLGHLGNTLFFGILGAGAFFGYYTYRYNQQEVQELIDSRKGAFLGGELWCEMMKWYLDQRIYFEGEMKNFANPRQDKLLPDQRRGGHEKTLVLDLDELLIYSDWTRERGWKVFKRPGVEDFIKQMAPYYEIVVYSHQHHTYVDPILDQLDPHHIAFRLYRADTQYKEGKHVRDLSKLNRDLNKVLFLSANPESYSLQPENAVKLKPWHKEQGDTMLVDMIPFLQFLAFRKADVRDVVRAYEDVDIPSTFRKRMKEMEDRQQGPGGRRSLFSNMTRQ